MTSLAAVHWNARPGVASACMHITGADAVGAAERAGQLASDPAMATCGSCRRAARAAGHSLPPAPPQSPRPPGRDRTAERRALRLMQVAVFAWYGETCSCCGTTENLSVDHAAGNGPEHRTEVYGYPGTRGYNPAKLYRWIIEHQFPADLGTMCRPCNWSKRDGDHCRLFHGPALAARQKWCGGCERVRDRQTDFGPDARRADKLSDTCRECARRHQANWRERHGTQRQVSTREGTAGGRILAYLAGHGQSQHSEIVAGTGLSFNSVSSNLVGLLKEGYVERPARRVYRLTETSLHNVTQVTGTT